MSSPDPFDLGYKKSSPSEVADALGIPLRDLDAWLRSNPEFEKERRRGQSVADAEDVRDVEEALIKSALGYEGERLTTDRRTGAIKRVEEFIEPSPRAQELFLTRRAAERWEKSDAPPERIVPPQVLIQINHGLVSSGEAPLKIAPPVAE